METRHSDNDGSDIFWPGYVDAVTNLVLNLLFLLTIMTVAVFMFALELGRRAEMKQPTVAVTKKSSKATTDPVKENIALKREIQRLNLVLAQQASKTVPVPKGGVVKTVEVTATVPKPSNGIDKTVATDHEVIVRFKDEAVAFTQAEHERLLETLKPMIASGKAGIYVDVPAGFSEAKRMGLYRAMAVRNLLIEMNLPKDLIDVSVREVKTKANAAIVRVRAR